MNDFFFICQEFIYIRIVDETITITPPNGTNTITLESGMIITSVILTSTLGITIAVVILRRRRNRLN